MIELRKGLIIPELSRERVSELYAQGLLAIEPIIVDKIKLVLFSQEAQDLIRQGKITFAMVKPRLDESTDLGTELTDPNIARAIVEEIEPPLEVVIDASFVFDEEMIDEFYGGTPKERQLEFPAMDANRYGISHSNRWEEFKALMKQGPVTGLILYSEEGNAVAEWRNQMGDNWNMSEVKEEYPESIRARFGKTNHNNLVHGSDSIESVEQEIAFFIKALEKMAKH